MAYSLLIHLRGVHDHRAALSSIVSAWHDTFRIPILFFSNKGPGRPPDTAFVQERATFGRLDDGISVLLDSEKCVNLDFRRRGRGPVRDARTRYRRDLAEKA